MLWKKRKAIKMGKCSSPVQYKGYLVCPGVEWEYDKKTLTVRMFTNHGQYDLGPVKHWENKCPWCGKTGVLRAIGKKGRKIDVEGAINCSNCDADFDGVKGQDKEKRPKYLKSASSSSASATAQQLSSIAKTKKSVTKELKEEYKQSKNPKKSMTLKTPPLKDKIILDGYCHQLSPPLVSKDLIVFVESVEITQDSNVMVLNDKLEAPGEEYKPPSEKKTSNVASNYNANSAIEKEIMGVGNGLKASTDLNTVKNIYNWLKVGGGGKFSYPNVYFNWPGGDITKANPSALTKRWNMKSGNCVFFAWCFYLMCAGAGVTVEIWNGNATFGSGKTYGHLWNKYKGTIYDCSSSSSRNFQGKKIK
jgi:hypothetical protein